MKQAGAEMHTEKRTASIGGRRAIFVLLTLLLAMILPRWQAITGNLMIADDWAVTYRDHLANGRLIPAFDLWLGNALTGGNYLSSPFPAVICVFALSLAGWFLIKYLIRLGAGLYFATAAIACWLAHPAMNEYLLWKVTSGATVSLAIAIVSFHLLDMSESWRGFLSACAVLVLAVTGYQILVVLPVMLYGLRIVISGRILLKDRRLWQVPLMTVIAAVIAVMVQLILSRLLGGPTDGRGLGSFDHIGHGWLVVRLQNALNLLANLSQQGFGVIFGVGAAWSYWELPYVLLVAIGVGVSLWSPAQLVIRALLPLLSMLVPAGLFFFLNTVHADPRIAAMGVLIYFCVGWGLLGNDSLWQRRAGGSWARGFASALIAGFALLQTAATTEDAEYRRAAYLDFTKGMAQLRESVARAGLDSSRLALASAPMSRKNATRELHAPVVSYQVVRVIDYLPFKYAFFLDGIAGKYGFKPGQCPDEMPCVSCAVNVDRQPNAMLLVEATLFRAYLVNAPGREGTICLLATTSDATFHNEAGAIR